MKDSFLDYLSYEGTYILGTSFRSQDTGPLTLRTSARSRVRGFCFDFFENQMAIKTFPFKVEINHKIDWEGRRLLTPKISPFRSGHENLYIRDDHNLPRVWNTPSVRVFLSLIRRDIVAELGRLKQDDERFVIQAPERKWLIEKGKILGSEQTLLTGNALGLRVRWETETFKTGSFGKTKASGLLHTVARIRIADGVLKKLDFDSGFQDHSSTLLIDGEESDPSVFKNLSHQIKRHVKRYFLKRYQGRSWKTLYSPSLWEFVPPDRCQI